MSINLPYRSSWLLQYLFSCKYFVTGSLTQCNDWPFMQIKSTAFCSLNCPKRPFALTFYVIRVGVSRGGVSGEGGGRKGESEGPSPKTNCAFPFIWVYLYQRRGPFLCGNSLVEKQLTKKNLTLLIAHHSLQVETIKYVIACRKSFHLVIHAAGENSNFVVAFLFP